MDARQDSRSITVYAKEIKGHLSIDGNGQQGGTGGRGRPLQGPPAPRGRPLGGRGADAPGDDGPGKAGGDDGPITDRVTPHGSGPANAPFVARVSSPSRGMA